MKVNWIILYSRKTLGFIAVLFIILVLSSTLLTSGSISLQQTENDSKKVENLFSILEESNNTVTEIFRQLEEQGMDIPQESYNEYNQALVLADESQMLIQSGDYSQAENKIIQAFDKFREALNLAYAKIDDHPPQVTAIEKYYQIQSTLNRYKELLDQIQKLTDLISKAGFNTTIIRERIQLISSLLVRASNNLEQNNLASALRNAAEAKKIADNLINRLKEFAANLKTERLEQYIANTEERLALIRITANSLSATYPPTTIENVISALEIAESSLDNAKIYLENDQINNSLVELANSKESEEEAVSYLKPETPSEDTSLDNTSSIVAP